MGFRVVTCWGVRVYVELVDWGFFLIEVDLGRVEWKNFKRFFCLFREE